MFENLETPDVFAAFRPEKAFFERLTTAQLEEIHKELTGKGFKVPTTKVSAVTMVAIQALARNWLPKVLRAGMSSLDALKLDNELAKVKAPKAEKKITVVGKNGKTEKRKRAA